MKASVILVFVIVVVAGGALWLLLRKGAEAEDGVRRGFYAFARDALKRRPTLVIVGFLGLAGLAMVLADGNAGRAFALLEQLVKASAPETATEEVTPAALGALRTIVTRHGGKTLGGVPVEVCRSGAEEAEVRGVTDATGCASWVLNPGPYKVRVSRANQVVERDAEVRPDVTSDVLIAFPR